MLHKMCRNIMLITLLISIMGACSGKSGIDPIMPEPERVLAENSGYLVINLSPTDEVSIEAFDFTYDMNFDWDEGLIVENEGHTVYDFRLQAGPNNDFKCPGVIHIRDYRNGNGYLRTRTTAGGRR